MAVKKYRSVEDMEDLFWATPGTLQHRQAVRLVIEHISFLASTSDLPRGVFKFRSVEEAEASRQTWERKQARGQQ